MVSFSNHGRLFDRLDAGRRRTAPSRLIAAAGLGCCSLLTGIVLIRRLAGAFSGDVSVVGYSTCLLVAGFVCGVLKVIAEWPPHALDRRSCLMFGTLINLPLAVFAFALWPASQPGVWPVLALLWLSFVGWFCLSMRSTVWLREGVGQVAWRELERFLFPFPQTTVDSSSSLGPIAGGAPSAQPLAIPPAANGVRLSDSSDGVISELQRRSTAAGGDLLEGQLVAVFATGARQTVLHIPFIPPFIATPHLECEIADGVDARVKIGAVFPYGARLELKRSTSDLAELHVALEIFAETATGQPADAA